MPKLFSRMDEISWLTPSVSDILDQGAAPPGGNGSIREQMLLLQKKLGDLETPARVINVRPTPSYTLFIAKPDTIGDMGNRRPVTVNEIKRSLAHIAEEKKEWKLGFIPQLQETHDAVGILLRTDEHSPLSLRRLLVRSEYRDHPSSLALVVGNTLEQHIYVKDLASIGNMLVIGNDATQQNFINSVLLTLLVLNTPGELRLAISAQPNEAYQLFTQTPHILGRILPQPVDAIRLLNGLVAEMERRLAWFEDENVSNVDEYNQLVVQEGKTRLPRIVFLIDSFSDPQWQQSQDKWISQMTQILHNVGKAGIHLIISASNHTTPDIPENFRAYFPVTIVSRNAGGEFTNKLNNFHGSLMRFVDAFVIEGVDENIMPLELCIISKSEIEKTINFWELVTEQRKRETQKSQISGKTGVTGTLAIPPQVHNETETTQKQAHNVEQSEASVVMNNDNVKSEQAQALAAYLGWIGVGPLQDIFGMTVEEAKSTLEMLKTMGVVEQSTSPTPRFVRLISRSPDED